jgi:hypothetical protein
MTTDLLEAGNVLKGSFHRWSKDRNVVRLELLLTPLLLLLPLLQLPAIRC